MEHNKLTSTISFDDTEMAVMPGMDRHIADHEVPQALTRINYLGNQCIQELIGTGRKSPMFSSKDRATNIKNRLQKLHEIYDDLEKITPNDQLTIPGIN